MNFAIFAVYFEVHASRRDTLASSNLNEITRESLRAAYVRACELLCPYSQFCFIILMNKEKENKYLGFYEHLQCGYQSYKKKSLKKSFKNKCQFKTYSLNYLIEIENYSIFFFLLHCYNTI